MLFSFAKAVSERANGLTEWHVATLVLSFLLYRTFRKWVDGSKVSPGTAFLSSFTASKGQRGSLGLIYRHRR